MLILIVDDEPEIREALTHFLETAGWTAVTASNGKEGLDKFNAHPVDCVLCDVRMPVMDGLQMLKALKGTAKAHVPVVIMTGYSDASREEILASGAVAMLNKPFDLQELLDVLAKAVRKP